MFKATVRALLPCTWITAGHLALHLGLDLEAHPYLHIKNEKV